MQRAGCGRNFPAGNARPPQCVPVQAAERAWVRKPQFSERSLPARFPMGSRGELRGSARAPGGKVTSFYVVFDIGRKIRVQQTATPLKTKYFRQTLTPMFKKRVRTAGETALRGGFHGVNVCSDARGAGPKAGRTDPQSAAGAGRLRR